MLRIDRRRWLQAVGLAIGSTASARLLGTETPARPAREAGIQLARLSLNENPYGPAPGAIEAIQREFSNLCRYTGEEFEVLVGLIAAREGVLREQVILGEILEPLGTYLSLQGGSGGEFIFSDPGYTALIDAAVAVGGRAVGVPLGAQMENDLPAIAARVN